MVSINQYPHLMSELEKRNNKLFVKNKQLEKENEELKKKLNYHKTEHELIENENKKWRKKDDILEKENEKLKKKNRELDDLNFIILTSFNQEKELVDELKQEIDELKKENEELKKQNEVLESKLISLENTNNVINSNFEKVKKEKKRIEKFYNLLKESQDVSILSVCNSHEFADKLAGVILDTKNKDAINKLEILTHKYDVVKRSKYKPLQIENEELKKEVKRITKLYWKLRNDEVKEIEKKIFGD